MDFMLTAVSRVQHTHHTSRHPASHIQVLCSRVSYTYSVVGACSEVLWLIPTDVVVSHSLISIDIAWIIMVLYECYLGVNYVEMWIQTNCRDRAPISERSVWRWTQISNRSRSHSFVPLCCTSLNHVSFDIPNLPVSFFVWCKVIFQKVFPFSLPRWVWEEPCSAFRG